ncbi:DUF6129 family protein [Bradyrhizobium iriomotense]|uniref:DUF6129 domain-containing protein n=1 Tax=Bradyrhizobium iriomotense TaxID=441950 RepID=A0ABQ6B987_9BRAD|nr:DUF6129 family protein [Bradyrhizobium iriomotense]GLR90046.1 hypothetical protein GCM10007857_67600 [Bradyrhizobium iriomotense]
MALGADEIADIAQELGSFDDVSQAYAALRQRYPNLSWIRCDSSDLTEIPFCSIGPFDLHLLDGADHCARITHDPMRATGIVLARRAAEL